MQSAHNRLAAIPASLAIAVAKFNYVSAVAKPKAESESEEVLNTSIREVYRAVSAVKNLDD